MSETAIIEYGEGVASCEDLPMAGPRRILIGLLVLGAACGDGTAERSPPAPTAAADNAGSDVTADADGGADLTEPATPSTPTAGDDGDLPSRVRTLTVAATGDVLPHSPLWRRAANDAEGGGYDFGPMFAEIAPALAATDLAICHLETPIAPEGEELSTDPLYGVPPEIADAIAGAGFDRCSTASNHAFDRGVAGIDRTVEVLTAAGIAQSGMARTETESRPTVFDANGIAISHLSYTYGHNGNYVPPGEEWRAPLIDADRIIFDAKNAREQGAEVVIASMHWGNEGEAEPSASQRAVAEAVTASGQIDLIIGHHAHVLQPIERVNGVWVAFGLGNILSNLPVNDSWPAATQDAAIVEFSIVVAAGGPVEVGAPTVRPTWVDKNDGWVIRDVLAELDDPAIGDQLRGRLTDSLDRTLAVLGAYVVPGVPPPTTETESDGE